MIKTSFWKIKDSSPPGIQNIIKRNQDHHQAASLDLQAPYGATSEQKTEPYHASAAALGSHLPSSCHFFLIKVLMRDEAHL